MLSILMVDADAMPGDEGLDWTSAFHDFQNALTQATVLNADGDANNNIDQIWIAEETYMPSALLESGDARSASFSLLDDVTLYGGFLGTETMLDNRDWSVYSTILSGDLGVLNNISDNAYTVVFCGTDNDAAVDGLSVVDGNANGSHGTNHDERNCGGGIYNIGTLTVTNSTLSGNSVSSFRKTLPELAWK